MVTGATRGEFAPRRQESAIRRFMIAGMKHGKENSDAVPDGSFSTQRDGDALWVFGQMVRVLTDGIRQNDGSYDLVEILMPPGSVGSPSHSHELSNDHLIVLSGEIEAELDGTSRLLRAGEHFRSPADTEYGWSSVGLETCRVLICSQPSGMVRFYRSVGTPLGPPSSRASGRIPLHPPPAGAGQRAGPHGLASGSLGGNPINQLGETLAGYSGRPGMPGLGSAEAGPNIRSHNVPNSGPAGPPIERFRSIPMVVNASRQPAWPKSPPRSRSSL